jgi:hypothetical protein
MSKESEWIERMERHCAYKNEEPQSPFLTWQEYKDLIRSRDALDVMRVERDACLANEATAISQLDAQTRQSIMNRNDADMAAAELEKRTEALSNLGYLLGWNEAEKQEARDVARQLARWLAFAEHDFPLAELVAKHRWLKERP